jgi:hypothetical protein
LGNIIRKATPSANWVLVIVGAKSRLRSKPLNERYRLVTATVKQTRSRFVRAARTLAGSLLRLLQSVLLLVGADQQRHCDRNIENTCDAFQRR